MADKRIPKHPSDDRVIQITEGDLVQAVAKNLGAKQSFVRRALRGMIERGEVTVVNQQPSAT